jgi:signal transduction histidine kinase
VPTEIQPFVDSMRALLGELTAALDRQSRFVANAAHELRSPIAALGLQASNVERVVEDAEALARLGELQNGIRRMQHMLEQLLSMARVEGGGAAPRPVLLSEVAREVLAELVPDAQARGIDLGMDRCDADLCIEATELDIRALLYNVASNAVKYCAARCTVTLSIAREGSEALVAIEDDGPGIAPEHRSRVLEPFYRVPGASEPGSGLGLSIVAAVAQQHGGRVSLTSGAGGRGLRFEYRQRSCGCGSPAVPDASTAKHI